MKKDDEIKLIIAQNENLKEQNKELQYYARLFEDEYFNGLKAEEIIALAKKSVRLGADNSTLTDAMSNINHLLKDGLYNEAQKIAAEHDIWEGIQ